MKRRTAAMLTCVMFAFALFSVSALADEAVKPSDLVSVITNDEIENMDVLYYYLCDESIFSESFDDYFEGGAEAGVEALLDAGKVYINGVALPAEADEFELNGKAGLTQLENGKWTWATTAWSTYTGDTELEFSEARKNYLGELTTSRGMTVAILAEEGNRVADAVAVTIYSSALVQEVVENDDGTITVEGPSVTVDAENFDSSVEAGDIVLYWTEADGMHVERAIAETGIYHYEIGDADAEAYETDTIDGESYIDARMSRTIQSGSRPNQFARALKRLGLQDNEVIGWWTATHYLIGFTRDTESARATLEAAIVSAEAGTEGVVVSEDGTDVETDTWWVTQDVWEEYQEILSSAKELLEDENATGTQLDQMISDLADAYGSETATGDHMSGPLGVIGSMVPGSKS